MGNVHRLVPLMLPSTRIHVIVVSLFWLVHGECTEGISVN